MSLAVRPDVHGNKNSAANYIRQAPLVEHCPVITDTQIMEKLKRRRGKDERTPDELADAARLKALWGRRPKGLTQEAVANKMGVTKAVVSQHLSGVTALTWKAVLVYSDVLGVSTSEISPRLTKKNLPSARMDQNHSEEQPGSTGEGSFRAPPGLENTWVQSPPAARALVEIILQRSSEKSLTDEDIQFLLGAVSRISKDLK